MIENTLVGLPSYVLEQIFGMPESEKPEEGPSVADFLALEYLVFVSASRWATEAKQPLLQLSQEKSAKLYRSISLSLQAYGDDVTDAWIKSLTSTSPVVITIRGFIETVVPAASSIGPSQGVNLTREIIALLSKKRPNLTRI